MGGQYKVTEKIDGKKRQTKDRRKSDCSDDAASRGRLAKIEGKSRSSGHHKDSTSQPIRKGGIVDGGSFRRKAGGILRQKLLNTKTQLAFYEEQIRRLKHEAHQLEILCEEFAKAEEVGSEAITQFSDEELE